MKNIITIILLVITTVSYGQQIIKPHQLNTGTLTFDNVNNRIGIGTSSPNKTLHVVGQTIVSNSSPSYSAYPESDLLLLSGGSTGRYGISIGNHLEGGSTKAYFHYDRDNLYTVFGSGSTPGGSNPVFLLNSFVGGNEYDFMRVLADGEIQLKVSGSEKLVVKPTGNVGIGTVSPNAPLEVQADGGGTSIRVKARAAANSGTIRFFDNASSTQLAKIESSDNSFEIGSLNNVFAAFLTNGTEKMRITSTGNVGIGTSSPANKLDVRGTSRITNSDGASMLYVTHGATTGNTYTEVDALIGSGGGWGNLIFQSGGGNVGIGTTNPQSNLEINGDNVKLNLIQDYATYSYGDTKIFLGHSDASGNNITITHNSAYADLFIDNNYDAEGGAYGRFYFRQNILGSMTTVMSIRDNKVGIGTTTPSQKLDVVGKIALNDGGNSVFIGTDAGINDDASTNYNVGIGYQAMYNNTTGYQNAATGTLVLATNTTGFNNVANGHLALRFNTTGYNNVAIGTQGLYFNTEGIYNTATGHAALYNNIGGTYNTAVGGLALYSNTTGIRNTAHGYGALYNNTIGGYNTSVGMQSLYSGIEASYNTALGYRAGRYYGSYIDLTYATNSIFIGVNSRASANGNTNEIVIGHTAIGQGSNTIMLGNSSHTSLFCYDTSISSPSDARDKTNVESLVDGLDFVNTLRPVAFQWSMREGTKQGINDVGFIAQELHQSQSSAYHKDYLELADYMPNSDTWFAQYANLIPVYAKAIQDLDDKIETQQQEIDNLQTIIQQLITRIETLENQ